MLQYRPVTKEEITRPLFRAFIRHQTVSKCYRKDKNGQWVIRDAPFIDDWTEEDYRVLLADLRRTIDKGGFVCGAFSDGTLKGFVSVESEIFGGAQQYMDMTSLHVSEDMRGQGIGRTLFAAAAAWAAEKGAKKLYISAHSAVETQRFYHTMGCTDAILPNAAHVEKEPFDRQMEYDLKQTQNIYDDPQFSRQYADMPRSKNGLSSAGEWHQLEPLIPPLKDKTVLDLGCGYGWHCRYAAEHGAEAVLGIDSSETMITHAHSYPADARITYRVCDAETYDYPENTWDVVVSNLVLHYIEALEPIFRKIHRTLMPHGTFLCNMEHPCFTAGVGQEWVRDADGQPLYWPIDRYFTPGPRVTRFLDCTVIKQHHTLTQILMGLIQSGFSIEAVIEAEPPQEMLSIPGMQDELRRPMMLLIRASANK